MKNSVVRIIMVLIAFFIAQSLYAATQPAKGTVQKTPAPVQSKAPVGTAKSASTPIKQISVIGKPSIQPTKNPSTIINNFFTSAGSAGKVMSIENMLGDAYQPAVGIDDAGNIIAVWQQWDSNPMRYNIWSNRYDAVSGTWGTAGAIGSDPKIDQGDVEMLHIAMNGKGNAVVVWLQFSPNDLKSHVWANEFYANSLTWGVAKRLGQSSLLVGEESFPQVAINDAGYAVAAWESIENERSRIRASIFTGKSWTNSELIDFSNMGDAEAPQVAINDWNYSQVVWIQDNGKTSALWSNQTYDLTHWNSSAIVIDPGTQWKVYYPKIATNNHSSIIVWEQYSTKWRVMANVCYLKKCKTTTVNEGGDSPSVAIKNTKDGTHEAVIVWLGGPGGWFGTYLYSSRYSFGTDKWDGPVPIGEQKGVSVKEKISMDDFGNVYMVCEKLDTSESTPSIIGAGYDVLKKQWSFSPVILSKMSKDDGNLLTVPKSTLPNVNFGNQTNFLDSLPTANPNGQTNNTSQNKQSPYRLVPMLAVNRNGTAMATIWAIPDADGAHTSIWVNIIK